MAHMKKPQCNLFPNKLLNLVKKKVHAPQIALIFIFIFISNLLVHINQGHMRKQKHAIGNAFNENTTTQ